MKNTPITITVTTSSDNVISVDLGCVPNSVITLIDSTFEIAENGTVLERFTASIPEGLHAFAVLCRKDDLRVHTEQGRLFLGGTPHVTSTVFLGWRQRGVQPMFRLERACVLRYVDRKIFNPYLPHPDTPMLILDIKRKTAYFPMELPYKDRDAELRYVPVPMHLILEYITRRITLEDLAIFA